MENESLESLLRALDGDGTHAERCPEPERLVDFVLDRLERTEASDVDRRIRGCAECVALVERLRLALAAFRVEEARLSSGLQRLLRAETESRSVAGTTRSLDLSARTSWGREALELLGEVLARLAALAASQPARAMVPGFRGGGREIVRARVEPTGGEPSRSVEFHVVRADLDATGRLDVDLSLAPGAAVRAGSEVRMSLETDAGTLHLPRAFLSPEGRATLVARLPSKIAIRHIPARALTVHLSSPIDAGTGEGDA